MIGVVHFDESETKKARTRILNYKPNYCEPLVMGHLCNHFPNPDCSRRRCSVCFACLIPRARLPKSQIIHLFALIIPPPPTVAIPYSARSGLAQLSSARFGRQGEFLFLAGELSYLPIGFNQTGKPLVGLCVCQPLIIHHFLGMLNLVGRKSFIRGCRSIIFQPIEGNFLGQAKQGQRSLASG